MKDVKIAIFASGRGSNAVNIIKYFAQQKNIQFIILSNKQDALVLQEAERLNITSYTFNRETFYKTQKVKEYLFSQEVDYIVLAGFMWLVPTYLVNTFEAKIINIHPALLPKFGGKGMYGMNVHKAVIESGDKESGITIHFVNNQYDEGQIILQAKCKIDLGDTAELLAQKIHQLEYQNYPKVIEKLINTNFT
jgi:phosphoribosylglycinamide formyltransferase-1